MHPVSRPNTYQHVTDLVNHVRVKISKIYNKIQNLEYLENETTFLRNKKKISENFDDTF